MSDQDAGESHSKAFETFVDDASEADDVIGLLAYALYKQTIREDAIAGNVGDGRTRIPSATMVQAFRGAASQLLTGVIDRAIEESTSDIQKSAVLAAVAGMKTEVKAHIDGRTGWGTAVATNLAAWLISLALAFLILVLARAPEVSSLFANRVAPPAPTAAPQTPTAAKGG